MRWATQRVTCWWGAMRYHAELPQEWHDFMSLVPGYSMGMPHPRRPPCFFFVRSKRWKSHGFLPPVRVGCNSTIFWISRSLLHHFVNISMQNVQLWSDQTSLVCLGSAQQTSLFDKIRVCWWFSMKIFLSWFSVLFHPHLRSLSPFDFILLESKPQINLLFLFCAILSFYIPCCEGKLAPSQDEGGGVSPTLAMLSGRLQGRSWNPRMLWWVPRTWRSWVKNS